MRSIVFAALLAIALGFFGRTVYAMVRAAGRGRPDGRPRLDQLPARLVSVLIYFFGQKKVAEEGPQHATSKHHLFIFWGFLIITIGTAELIVNGVVPSFHLGLLMPDAAYTGLRSLIDVFNLIVLTMIGWALFRRIVLQPRLIPMNVDAGIILGAIGGLMVTHFLYHGFHGAAELTRTGALGPGSPVSGVLARALSPIDAGSADFGSSAAFWLHAGILLGFLNYLPYSKHIHLLGALPNIFTRNLSQRKLDLPKLDLEDEEQWGVGKFEQFSWKSLIDTYACTECARCSNYCPAYNTGKNLSPMQLVHDIRYEMLDRDALYAEKDELLARQSGMAGADRAEIDERLADLEKRIAAMPPMVGGRIADETLWACTTCGACQEVCPVFIEHPLKIIQMRQNLVLAQERIPADLGRTFRNIERQSNPWGISNEKRMDWADGLAVPLIEDNPDPEYILWVGCAGAFDQRITKQTKALVKVLNAAGVSYAVLGHAESCTGDPARRAGNEMLFQMQAEANVEALNGARARKVIASCPHCLHTLRHDYPQFGGSYEVVHHTQLLAHLMAEGKTVFPAFFSIGLSAGGTVVIPPIDYVRQSPADVDPGALLEVIRDCRVETLFASPVILENLARLGRDRGARAPSLRTVIGGGAPLYAEVIGPLRQMIGEGAEVHADYGATEALPATELPGDETLREAPATAAGRGLCVGRPFAGVELKVISIAGGPIATVSDMRELPAGEIGEVIVRGPHVSPRYADDPASTLANKIADPAGGVWHRLGDAGYLDAGGRLWCCGRLGHRVELATGTLFPLMVEPIFDAHPRVRRSALVGVGTPGAARAVLCVELVDGAVRGRDLPELRDQLLALAADHPTTREIGDVLFHRRLPVDPRHNSKIERPVLRRWAAARLPREGRRAAPQIRAVAT